MITSIPESLVARIVEERVRARRRKRLLLPTLLTNGFLGMPARLQNIEHRPERHTSGLGRPGAEGIENVAGFIGLVSPEAEQPSVAGCVPMLDEGADGDGDGYPAIETTLELDCRP